MKTSLKCTLGLCELCTKTEQECDCTHHEVALTKSWLSLRAHYEAMSHELDCCQLRHPSSYQAGGTIDQFMPVEELSPRALHLMYGDGEAS